MLRKLLTGLLFTALAAEVCFSSPVKPVKRHPLPLTEAHSWDTYKQHFGKSYRDMHDDYSHRLSWKSNLEFVLEHNERYKRNLTTFKRVPAGFQFNPLLSKTAVAVNKFADLSMKEFSSMYLGYRPTTLNTTSLSTVSDDRFHDGPVPDSMDWRDKNAVTGVKDQGQCKACYAFSVTGGIEGQHAIKTGDLVSLSEQQIIDCDTGTSGCAGGNNEVAFDHVAHNGGIDTEDSYPFEARDNQCRYNSGSAGATVSSYKRVKENSEAALVGNIAFVGPISVGIIAQQSFVAYHSGVYYEPNCAGDHINHAVLAVGYGSRDGQAYFLVKNSWGTDWGESGYVYMARNKDNNCAIATDGSYPVV